MHPEKRLPELQLEVEAQTELFNKIWFYSVMAADMLDRGFLQ